MNLVVACGIIVYAEFGLFRIPACKLVVQIDGREGLLNAPV